MSEKDVMIFNLPKEFTETDVRSLCKIKGVRVVELSTMPAINGTAIACAKITVQYPS